MEESEGKSGEEEIMSHLIKTADVYSNLSPSISRFHLSKLLSIRTGVCDLEETGERICPYCGSILQPGNNSVRVRPREKATKKILRLKKRLKQGKPVRSVDMETLTKFDMKKNSVATHCHICGEEDVRTGLKRRVSPKEKHHAKVAKMEAKEKEKRREKNSSDSGLGSLISSRSQVSLSSISSVGSTPNASLSSSLSSLCQRPISSLPSPFTSTPKVPRRSENLPASSFKAPSLTGSSSSLKPDHSLKESSKKTPNKAKGKKKSKSKGLSVLQRMISQQDTKDRNSKGGSLKQFLNSL